MGLTLDIWKLLVGVVIFLLGMNFLEEGLRYLVGRPFKLFLKKQTSNKLKAIGGGAIVTGVLQSSSIVNLMVLAFVGAGVIQMQNALAVMLGSNLGTTLASWIIATVGFKFNIESFAYPITGVAGMVMVLTNKESRWHNWSKFLFGFGFLFVGLNFIRTGIEDALKEIDLGNFNEQPAIVFLLIGLFITALVQASSVTIAIVLSALYANAISLFAATAIVLGAEIGTTLKLLLASAKGIAAKKRVALGNVLFNTINILIIFAVLSPVNRFITDVVGIRDNLLALVFFQSLVNLIGIILFYPFLGTFGRFLEKRFTGAENETQFIHRVKPADTELALIALEKEVRHFLYHVAAFTLDAFEKKSGILDKVELSQGFASKKHMEKYEYIKHLHGDLYEYIAGVQSSPGDKDTMNRLQQLIDAARNTMYAAKNIKDAYPDIEQLKKSSNDRKYEVYLHIRDNIAGFFEQVLKLLKSEKEDHSRHITEIYQNIQEGYRQMLKELHHDTPGKKMSEIDFSTIINFNREIYTCEKSIVFALKDYLLNEKEAAAFDDLPGFIR